MEIVRDTEILLLGAFAATWCTFIEATFFVFGLIGFTAGFTALNLT